jgi:tRNA U34 2-thiouridine synthase MnmA/TrmU
MRHEVGVKALGLLSGGLDSTLAAKLMLEQGVEVEAVNFLTPFCRRGRKRCDATDIASRFQIKLRRIFLGNEYLRMLRKPKHGYGKNMNPCIDCRILMLKKAKRYAKQIGVDFIFTGEVLDERPMSQYRRAMETIEREAGLEGRVLRPLSARCLPETEAERKGWIEREKLLDIKGRSRKRQIELARSFSLSGYPCPAGGCLLTDREFSAKLRDLFKHKRAVRLKDISLLKLGRHFRLGSNKIIVGRNERENKLLLSLRAPSDYYFEVPGCGSPITILQGRKSSEAIRITASLTARYSDAKGESIRVVYCTDRSRKTLIVTPPPNEHLDRLRIASK